MERIDLLAMADFNVNADGHLEINCPSYAIALEVWGIRQSLVNYYLRPFYQVRTLSISVAGRTEYPTIKIQRKSMLSPELTQELLTIGIALKSSAFAIHFDGTYLEYLEAGHPGKTIISYEEMIGQQAMERLPEPLRSLIIHHHHRAATTGITQHFIYTSPLTGKLFREILVPYPEHQIVAHFVLPADPNDEPTRLSQITQAKQNP